MSDTEQVQYFNPILILMWVLQLIILGMDYSGDQRVTWSIPIIGSFLLIQIYMIWKTNYDQMIKEQKEGQTRAVSGDLLDHVPIMQPRQNTSNQIINLELSPAIDSSEDDVKQLKIN
ncbi:MAG: hypothetical protein ACXAD7_19665 [Candidatus Kariarchaeaceae archaeon]